LYGFGGVNGTILKDRTGTNEFLRLQPSQVTFNEDGLDMDFRVESDTNTHALFVEGSGNNVGIGTSTLTSSSNYHTLSINGTTGGQLSFQTGGTGKHFFFSTATDLDMYSSVDGVLRFSTNNFERLEMSSSATIFNDIGADVDFRVESDGNANMLFVDGGLNRVGIGTASVPANRTLQVSSAVLVPIEATSSAGETIISLDNTSTNGRNYFLISGGTSGTYAGGKFGIFDADASADRMSIDSSGNVVFNEGSANADFRVESNGNANMLFVDASANTVILGTSVVNPASGFNDQQGFGYSNTGQVQIAATSNLATLVLGQNQGTNGSIIDFRKQSTIVGSISVTGSATAYNTSSDYRLKENIADADDAGSKIDAIQVRKYDWKADGLHQDYGMIAQELQAVVPEAVSGDADSEEMMGVDYSKLVPMLIKEIQSLRQRVAQLEE
jgi:hypothetical protein